MPHLLTLLNAQWQSQMNGSLQNRYKVHAAA